jgi:hypothetical protein
MQGTLAQILRRILITSPQMQGYLPRNIQRTSNQKFKTTYQKHESIGREHMEKDLK